jgi:hypothetical protein
MRRATRIVTLFVFLVVGFPSVTSSSLAVAAVVPACAANSVRITDYNTLVGAGNVNDLFRIRNVSALACSLRGYVRVEYLGVYGIGVSDAKPHPLTVGEARSYGRDGNDVGGLKKGLPIPTVMLQEHGVASFWLYGTDEQHGTPATSRCIASYKMLVWLPGSSTSITVQPLKDNGFFWCGVFTAHPIVPGGSGSDPAVRLSYYFGS